MTEKIAGTKILCPFHRVVRLIWVSVLRGLTVTPENNWRCLRRTLLKAHSTIFDFSRREQDTIKLLSLAALGDNKNDSVEAR